MARFPEPSGVEALRKIPAVTATLPQGTRLARIHFAGGAFPGAWNGFRHHGPTDSRFFDLASPLVLLDLAGPFVTTLGASTAIHSGSRPRARRWARRLHEADPVLRTVLAETARRIGHACA